MNSFKKISSALMAGLLAAAMAVPAAPVVQAETAVVEQSLLASSTTNVAKMTVEKIANQTYTGKAVKPKVTVKTGDTTLKSGTDYTLTYKNNVKVGTATVTIKGKGQYKGSKTVKFKIVPANASLKVKTSGNKITLSWSKARGAAGYQIYYSEDGGSYKQLTSTTKTSFSTTKLKLSTKRYKFKLRTYKKVGSTKYYSDWSSEVKAGLADDTLDYPDLKVTEPIRWMAWWDMDEDTEAAKLFKETYGTPGDDGKIFENISVSYGDRFDKLSTSIAADDSPDLFPFESEDFPNGAVRGRYNAIDTIVNLDSPKWEATKDLMENYKLYGNHYCAITEISLSNIMYYRTSMIKEIKAKDPQTMFKNGTWNWDTFLELARKWQASGEDRYVIDGYTCQDEFITSTGVPLIGFDGSKYVSNLSDPAVERAEALLATLQAENLRYPRHELNGWSVNTRAFANGNTLFYADGGTWVWEGTLSRYALKMGWDADEVKCVPFPKDPAADRYYVTLNMDSQMWVRGSKNTNGVQAWFDCRATAAMRNTSYKDEIAAGVKNYNWNKDNLEFIYSLTTLDGSSPVTPVVEFKNGLGYISDTSSLESPIQCLTGLPYLTGESFEYLRGQVLPTVNNALEEINSMIT